MKKHVWAIIILMILTVGLLAVQFRYPLALNYDGGYNAANTEALMHFHKMPYSGSPIIPFGLAAVFGLVTVSASAGVKIISTLSLVAVGWMIYAFIRKLTDDEAASIASLLGWCISLGVFSYICGYLKQTVALPFLVGGLMALWLAIDEKKPLWWILWVVGLVGTYLCHVPAVMAFAICSAFIAAAGFWYSTYKQGKTISIILWVCIGLGLISLPWSVPFLSKYVPQLSLSGWRTISIYIRGLFSHRYEMTTDFGMFDIPVLVLPVVGLALVWWKNKKLGWWLFAFSAGIMLLSLVAVKYEWQGRNVMTLFVPIAMLSGLGVWEISKLISKEKLARIILSVTIAGSLFFAAGWNHTIKQYIVDAKPVVSKIQLDDLSSFIGVDGAGAQYLPNLYARHGLRFWGTYATKQFIGVYFYDWDKKTFGVRQSRGSEELGESHEPGKGEYLLVAKFYLAGCPSTLVSGDKLKVSVPTKAQEYLGLAIDSTDKIPDVWLAMRDDKWNLIKKVHLANITYGSNNAGLLLTGVNRGSYWVQIGYGDQTLPPAKLTIGENLLQYAKTDFVKKAESSKYLIIEPK